MAMLLMAVMIWDREIDRSTSFNGSVHTTVSRLVFYAMAALACGVAIYLFDREASVYFVPDTLAGLTLTTPLFGNLGYQLPSFFHVYAFILLTVVCLPRGRAQIFSVCLAWFVIECLFELGQHPVLQSGIGAVISSNNPVLPLLEISGDYFLSGTFDAWDLLAAALGTVAAWLTINRSSHGKQQNE